MEKKLHINCLELLAGSFAVKIFTRDRLCVHVSLCEPFGGETHSLMLSNLALALWEWSLNHKMIISAEHLAGHLNSIADWESRNFRDTSNWRLDPAVFQSLMQIRGTCGMDLFADRLNSQLPHFFSWRPDPMAAGTDALQ